MSKPEEQQPCPFCGSLSRFHYVDYENRKHFFCEKCTEFEISRYAENIAASSTPEWREANSAAARQAPADSFYQLTRPNSQQTAASTAELVGVYVKRAP